MMGAQKLARLVRDMRKCQQEWLDSRTPQSRALARDLERRVDEAVLEVLSDGVRQTSLFEEAS